MSDAGEKERSIENAKKRIPKPNKKYVVESDDECSSDSKTDDLLTNDPPIVPDPQEYSIYNYNTSGKDIIDIIYYKFV